MLKDVQKWGQGSSAVTIVCQMCRDLRGWDLRLSQWTHIWRLHFCWSFMEIWLRAHQCTIPLLCTQYGLHICVHKYTLSACSIFMSIRCEDNGFSGESSFYLFWDWASLYCPGRNLLCRPGWPWTPRDYLPAAPWWLQCVLRYSVEEGAVFLWDVLFSAHSFSFSLSLC